MNAIPIAPAKITNAIPNSTQPRTTFRRATLPTGSTGGSVSGTSPPSGNSQCISGGARRRHAASSVGPIRTGIGRPCVLAWRLRAVARNPRPLPEEALDKRVDRHRGEEEGEVEEREVEQQ